MKGEEKSLKGLGFDEQKKLSGFATFSGCARLGDIAHDSDTGWDTLFQNKINSARSDGLDAFVLHSNGWHGYYETPSKECRMGICNCKQKIERGTDPHEAHMKGGYFQKGCDKCALFIGKYKMSGRKFRGEKE